MPTPTETGKGQEARRRCRAIADRCLRLRALADGKWLAVWAHDPETPGEKKQKDAKADASWVDHEKHGTRLYLAALKPDGQCRWRAQGRRSPARRARSRVVTVQPIVFLSLLRRPTVPPTWAPPEPRGSSTPPRPTSPPNSTPFPPPCSGAEFNTSGDANVFAAQTPEDAPPGYDELFGLLLRFANARLPRLTAGFAGQFERRGPSLRHRTVRHRAGRDRHAHLGGAHRPDGKPRPAAIDLVLSCGHRPQYQSRANRLAVAGRQRRPARQALLRAASWRRLHRIAHPELAPPGSRSVEPATHPLASGGLTIEGLLYMPPTRAPTKIPLVVDVHGGPFGAWENRNDPFAAFMVGHGWAVLRPNPRGSSNYGVKFAAANKNDLGGGDYSGRDGRRRLVFCHYPLDPARTALMGYSYGGEMAAFVEGKTDRFKAVISDAPVIDQFSEYGTEERLLVRPLVLWQTVGAP